MGLNDISVETVLEVLNVEILGEAGCKNIMNMFQTNPDLSYMGSLSREGIISLGIVKRNYDKILMWESL